MGRESETINEINQRLLQLAQAESYVAFSIVQEPATSYSLNFFELSSAIMRAIHLGIPFPLFQLITTISPFSESEWANILGLSTKSLQRYESAGNYSFKPIQSEKILQMTEVTLKGIDTFGSLSKFKIWLESPCKALGAVAPKTLLSNSYGKELILSELHRINHGILS